MYKGVMGKILFVDLSTGEINVEEPDEQVYRDFLGGYGLGARVLFSRQKAKVDPLGPDNMIGFVAGVLTGEQHRTRRSAHRAAGVVLSKTQTLVCQTIDVRSANLLLAVGADLVVTEIVGIDIDDVGFAYGRGLRGVFRRPTRRHRRSAANGRKYHNG